MSNYTATFIQKSTAKHGSVYGYSNLPKIFTYKDWVTILCPTHGEFKQKARTHATGSGCPTCAHDSRAKNCYDKKRHTLQDFINKAVSVHGDKYDYSQSVYVGQMKPINITCPIHGQFTQVANNHVHGNGCANCSDSRGERLVSLILQKLDVQYEQQKWFPNCFNPDTKKRKPLPFDFFIPSKNILIEFDGKHHYEPVPFNGVSHEKAVDLHERTKANDSIKNKFTKDNKYILLRIPFTTHRDKVEELISELL